MAHQSQMNFIQTIKNYPQHQHYFNNKKVLEIGSVNNNGTPRIFFTDCNYTGVDVAPGECVDKINFGHLINDPDETYDVVLSAECFEHDPYWMHTIKNMIRLCKKDGLIFFTCATTGRPEHGTHRTTPQDSLTTKLGSLGDYYRNLEQKDFEQIINFNEVFKFYWFGTNLNPADLYFCGIKR